MQMLLDMGSNQNSTIVFPIPIELIRPLPAAPVPMGRAALVNGTVPTNGAEPIQAQTAKSSGRRDLTPESHERHSVWRFCCLTSAGT
jgi:hypothetical protein